jgi:DNA-binding transcriptional LysR family regulator
MLVGLKGTCADSNIVLRACAQAGFEPRIAYTSDDYFAIQGLVASGMGVALVPGLALASTREDVAVRPLRGRPPYRRIGAVFTGEATGPLAVMLDCLRDAVQAYQREAPIAAVPAA